MIGMSVFAFGILYILAQILLVLNFEGKWLRAAYLPVPGLIILVVTALVLGMVSGANTGAIIVIGLPVAVVYLSILTVLRLFVRAVGEISGAKA